MIQKKIHLFFFISDVISTTTTTESLIDSVFDNGSIDTTTVNAITSTTHKGKLYES